MGLLESIIQLANNDTIVKATTGALGVAVGWGAKWIQGRDRYQAHVAWRTINDVYGENEVPFLIIQNVHDHPINVSDIRVVDGFRRNVAGYIFHSPDPDYPTWPILVEKHQRVAIALDEDKLVEATNRSWLLAPFYVSRVRIRIKTLGRWPKSISAETGLPWPKRRRRFR